MLKEEFEQRANKIHNNKYTYNNLQDSFNVNKTTVDIICPIHGEFHQNARAHYRGQGCRECAKEKMKHFSNTAEFKEKVIKKYGEKYDLSKVVYKGCEENVIIGCKNHGDFLTTPHNFLKGVSLCKECIREERVERAKKLRLTQDEFLTKLHEIHGDKFETDKAVYVNNSTLVTLKCPKHVFFNIKPIKLFTGEGCRECKQSKLERKIKFLLEKQQINFTQQCHFPWLGLQSLDFYLKDYRIAIECQGRQHFESDRYFGGEDAFKHRKELDKRKYDLCHENGIKLLYYSEEKKYDTFLGETLLKNTDELIQNIYTNNETTD